MKAQYMLAIIPPDEVRLKLEHTRQQISDTFQVKEALRNPIHITLVPPFHFEDAQIGTLIERLNTIKSTHFQIELNGFSGFPKNRVLFIKVMPSRQLTELHNNLVRLFNQTMPGINIAKLPADGYKPHVTMAYRDLSQYNYDKACELYFNSKYTDEWVANNFVLWKRVDKSWVTVNVISLS